MRLSVHKRDIRLTSPLLKYASNKTSQGGEDGIIQRVFDLLPDDGGPRYCVDIGSWDGKHLSNTYSLLRSGWHGLLVEADAARSAAAAELYRDNPRVACVTSMVTPESLPAMLREHGVPQEFSFLSIDIDGGDYHLLSSLRDSEFKPKLVCIEFNPTIPNCVSFVQEDSPQCHKGSSLRALHDLAQEMGYATIVTTTFNAFLLRSSLYCFMEDLPQPLSQAPLIEQLHSESMCTWMMQCYDGELKYAGVLKLLWLRRAINAQQLQVLRKKEWQFPFAPPPADTGSSSSSRVGGASKGAGPGGIEGAISIRRAAPSDFASIVELLDGWCDGPGLPLAYTIPRLLLEHVCDTSFVALDRDGEPIALLVGMVSQCQLASAPTGVDEHERRCSQLCHVGVSPRWRRLGVATALVERFSAAVGGPAGEYSCCVVRCEVEAQRRCSGSFEAFLRKAGFVEGGGGGEGRIVMERLLF